MSLLMDALKKAEEAKKTHQPSLTPVLEEEPLSPDHEHWEKNSPQISAKETMIPNEEEFLNVSAKETMIPSEEEFLIEKDLSSEHMTSSWKPWEGPSKEHRTAQEDIQFSEAFQASHEQTQDDLSPPSKGSMNWDEQWLPEFSEEEPPLKKEESFIVENNDHSVSSSPSFTLRDWKNESATKVDEPKTLTPLTLSWQNELALKENKEEVQTTRADHDEPFSTKLEKPLNSQKHKETQETAQRILAANVSPKSDQSKRFYSGLLLTVFLILGGGSYYYYTTAYQENRWLVPLEGSASFKTPIQKNSLENNVSSSKNNNTISSSPSIEEDQVVIKRDLLSKQNQNLQSSSLQESSTVSKSVTTESIEPVVLDKKEEVLVKKEQISTPKKQLSQSDSSQLSSSTQKFSVSQSTPSPDDKLSSIPRVQQSETKSSEPSLSSSLPTSSPVDKPPTVSQNQAPLPKKQKIPPASVTQEEIHHNNKMFKQEINKELSDAYMAFQRGDQLTAQQTYTEALAKDQNNRDALLGLAALAIQRGEPSTAQRHYQQILKLYPEDVHAQVGLITTLDYRSVGSEQQLKSLLEQTPQASYIHFSLGNLYARQGRWSLAQRAYFDAYHYESTKADYAYNLAISLDQINQPLAALDYYQKALQLSKNQTINFNLPSVHRRIQTLLNYSRHSTKSFQGISQMK